MKVKEESEKVDLKLNIQKTKIMTSSLITSWQIDGETVSDFILGGSKIIANGDCSHEIKRCLLLERKVMTNLIQFSSVSQSCLTLCNPMNHNTPGLPVHHQLPESTQTHVHWVGDAIQPSHPLLSPFPPALNLSQHQGLFKQVSSLHQVAKVLEFQLQHQSFQWIFRTDSFRMDWLDLLAVQGTLKRLLQPHSSKASILLRSAFPTQLSNPHMTTGKTIALTRRTFVDKVMSLLLNMLSSLVITFLPRSRRLLISWLQSPSAVILEPKK